MPRGDGMGPGGMGPMTGRGMGFCAGYNTPGFMNVNRGYPGYGRGRGRGMGYGQGWGRRGAYGAPMSYTGPIDSKAVMTDQVNFLEEQLEEARRQLAEIEKNEGQ